MILILLAPLGICTGDFGPRLRSIFVLKISRLYVSLVFCMIVSDDRRRRRLAEGEPAEDTDECRLSEEPLAWVNFLVA